MATPVPWSSLLYLKPSDFRYPKEIDASVAIALDRFVHIVGRKPIIIDDWRAPGTKSEGEQHQLGRAIDTTWPGIEPTVLWQAAHDAKLFNGLGVYVNEQGVASFHFDTRIGDKALGHWVDRTPQNPATWGGIISHPYDPNTGRHVKKTEYVGASSVIDLLKKKVPLALMGLLLLFAVWKWRPARSR